MSLPRQSVLHANASNRSYCQPALSRYFDLHDHAIHAAIARHSHKLNVSQCHKPKEHRRHHDNTLMLSLDISPDRLKRNFINCITTDARASRQHLPVSQIWALIVLLSTTILRVANSTPIVDFDSRLNSLRVNRESKLLFPTPESPIRTTEREPKGISISCGW